MTDFEPRRRPPVRHSSFSPLSKTHHQHLSRKARCFRHFIAAHTRCTSSCASTACRNSPTSALCASSGSGNSSPRNPARWSPPSSRSAPATSKPCANRFSPMMKRAPAVPSGMSSLSAWLRGSTFCAPASIAAASMSEPASGWCASTSPTWSKRNLLLPARQAALF
jgi:hypothetical protein